MEVNWTRAVKIGDYVRMVSHGDEQVRERVKPVTRLTGKSIFCGQQQFSKKTGIQRNNKRRVEPFMEHHTERVEN